jgi:hypothetical protein
MATKERRNLIAADLESQYNRDGDYFTHTDENGQVYDVVFGFSVDIRDEAGLEVDIMSGGIEDNYYYVFDPSETVGADNSVTISPFNRLNRRDIQGGNLGLFNTQQVDKDEGTPSHEINWGYGGDKDLKLTLDVLAGRSPIGYLDGETVDISVSYGYRYADTNELVDIGAKRRVTQSNVDNIFKNVTFDETGKADLGRELARSNKIKPNPKMNNSTENF